MLFQAFKGFNAFLKIAGYLIFKQGVPRSLFVAGIGYWSFRGRIFRADSLLEYISLAGSMAGKCGLR